MFYKVRLQSDFNNLLSVLGESSVRSVSTDTQRFFVDSKVRQKRPAFTMAISLHSERSDVETVPAEKQKANHVEYQSRGLSPEDADFLANFPEDKKKKVIRKVDVRMAPSLDRNSGLTGVAEACSDAASALPHGLPGQDQYRYGNRRRKNGEGSLLR